MRRIPLARATRDRLRAWRYEASADGGGSRDLRIDLLRGFCVFVMIVDHVGGASSWLYALTGGDRSFVSAAEGFVLLSGISMGIVHRGVIERMGIRRMFGKVVGRAWTLYALTVTLTITFAVVSAALGTPWAAEAAPATSGSDFALSVAALRRSYSLVDVLLLYTLLVLAAGLALWLISRGRTRLVVASSWALWALAQLWPGGPPEPWGIVDGGFPFAAWQVVFFSGLALGYHRRRIEPWLTPARLVATGLAGVAALAVVQTVAAPMLGIHGVDLPQLLFDKNDARAGRVLALLTAASFAWTLVTLAWVPLRRATGWIFLRFGRMSLFAYGAQLFVVAFWWSAAVAPLRAGAADTLANTLYQASAIAMVFTACVAWPRLRDLARSIPAPGVVLSPARLASGVSLALPLLAAVSLASGTALGNGLATPVVASVQTLSGTDAQAAPATAAAPADAAPTARDALRAHLDRIRRLHLSG